MAKGQKEAKVLFSADVSQFTQGITQINKSLSNLKSDLKACNADIKANGASFDNLSDKQKTLKQVISQLNDKLENQERCLKSAKDILGEGSEQYNRYYRAINNTKAELAKFQRELTDTEKALDEVANEAKDASDKLEDIDNAFDKAEVGAIGLGSALGNLASNSLDFCIDKIQEFAQYLWELPEKTEEFRQSLARVETVAKGNGKSLEDLNGLYKELYSYYTDHNATGNVVAQLAQIEASQSTLKDTTKALQGAWAEFGDGINNESLAEDINLTVKLSEAQGALKEVFERSGIDVEKFNEKLATCRTEEDKLTYINGLLNDSLEGSRKAYEEAYNEQIEYNDQMLILEQKEADLAEAIIPIQTEWMKVKGILLEEVTPALQTLADESEGKLTGIIDFINNNKDAFVFLGDAIKNAFEYLIPVIDNLDEVKQGFENIVQPVMDVIGFLADLKKGFEQGLDPVANLQQAIENFGKRSKEEIIASGDVTERQFNKMERDAQNAFGSMENQAGQSGDKMSQEVIDFTNRGKTNLTSLGTHNYQLNKPQTGSAEDRLASAVGDMKKDANTLSTHSYQLKAPTTSSATSGLSGALSTMRASLSNFKPSWSIPKPKLPKISVGSRTIGVGKLSVPIPTFSVSWGWKGGIINSPTVFPTMNGLVGVGDRYKGLGSNAEAILPLDSFYNYLDNKLDNSGQTINIVTNLENVNIKDDRDVSELAKAITFQIQREMRFK